MKILFTCTYSWPSISGVWSRVENIALELIRKKYEVHVFSSNLEAGTKNILPPYEVYKGIHIHRFKPKNFGSKNAFRYSKRDLIKKLKEIKPNVVDCQTYRHQEGIIISKECQKLEIPCYLTTHAPFVEPKVRGFWLSLLANVFDLFSGKKSLKRFKKIIAITKWEYPHLISLGVPHQNIVYIPNGIPEEFFKTKPKKGKGILFLGRITPVKDLETLSEAVLINKSSLDITGPGDEKYINQLKTINPETKFSGPILGTQEKIKKIDSAEIFVLSSKREGMPIALIEAMARGRIVVSSKNQGGLELIKDKKNGFLFDIGNKDQLAEIIMKINSLPIKQKNKMSDEARQTAGKFKWKDLVIRIEKLYSNRD